MKNAWLESIRARRRLKEEAAKGYGAFRAEMQRREEERKAIAKGLIAETSAMTRIRKKPIGVAAMCAALALSLPQHHAMNAKNRP